MEETYPLLPYESTTRKIMRKEAKKVKPIDYALLAELDDQEV